MRTNLANRVRELRYTKGWGPDDLAERAKISRTALYHLETGRTGRPQAATLRRLARALGVTPEELLREGEGTGPSSKGIETPSRDYGFPQPGLRVEDLFQYLPGAPAPRVQPVGERITPDVARKAIEKFMVLLSSPMAGGLVQLVDESFRLMPTLSAAVVRPEPAPAPEPVDLTADDEIEPKPRRRNARSQPRTED